MKLIWNIQVGKIGNKQRQTLNRIVEDSPSHDAILLGCTELPLLLPLHASRPIIDVNAILAQAAIREYLYAHD